MTWDVAVMSVAFVIMAVMAFYTSTENQWGWTAFFAGLAVTLLVFIVLMAGADSADAHEAGTARPQGCAQAMRYATAAGLPAGWAKAIAWRESGCDNQAMNHNRNGSHDHGWFQLNDVIWRDARMKPRLARCGAHTPAMVRGTSDAAMRRSACAAAALYRVTGGRAWAR